MKYFEIEETLRDKCFILTSMILAHYDVIDLSPPANEYWCIFSNDFHNNFKTKFIKELIELTGVLRVIMDIESFTFPVKNEEFGFNQSVGILNVNNLPEPLSFRESCNKIIHALSYEIKLQYSSQHPLFNGKNGYEYETMKFKKPILVTHGKFNKNTWISELNFLNFIDLSMNMIMDNK